MRFAMICDDADRPMRMSNQSRGGRLLLIMTGGQEQQR
jgi:hypothetical protein